ncbi:CBS domain-containing protein [Streptomyces mirabilis]|uniref:hypothetical protein n=1 Tax=Streptomyces mirabilis TaxID=68239 RepID=UPI003684FDA6
MRARDLARPYPAVSADDDCVEAARLLVHEWLPALLVVDRDGQPHAIEPAAQIIRTLVPRYVLEARVRRGRRPVRRQRPPGGR